MKLKGYAVIASVILGGSIMAGATYKWHEAKREAEVRAAIERRAQEEEQMAMFENKYLLRDALRHELAAPFIELAYGEDTSTRLATLKAEAAASPTISAHQLNRALRDFNGECNALYEVKNHIYLSDSNNWGGVGEFGWKDTETVVLSSSPRREAEAAYTFYVTFSEPVYLLKQRDPNSRVEKTSVTVHEPGNMYTTYNAKIWLETSSERYTWSAYRDTSGYYRVEPRTIEGALKSVGYTTSMLYRPDVRRGQISFEINGVILVKPGKSR